MWPQSKYKIKRSVILASKEGLQLFYKKEKALLEKTDFIKVLLNNIKNFQHVSEIKTSSNTNRTLKAPASGLSFRCHFPGP